MSGIIVGVDGSANARHALVWAVREAAAKHEHLTVLTVNEVAAARLDQQQGAASRPLPGRRGARATRLKLAGMPR